MCLPLTALIFMSVNFVILLTITSIQIYEEELMRVYFQLMYYSWINTSKHQNHPIRTSNHTQVWHEISKGLSVETGGVWWNTSSVSNWGEFLKASSWNVPHDHIFASFWLTELAQYLPRSWSAQNLTAQKSLSPDTPPLPCSLLWKEKYWKVLRGSPDWRLLFDTHLMSCLTTVTKINESSHSCNYHIADHSIVLDYHGLLFRNIYTMTTV